MKIPYQLVSMAAMLRDFFALNSDDYLNEEHQMLTDIADYLYNSADGAFSDHPEDNLLPEFKVIFDNYGADYFKQVTDDMYAIDSQVTSTAKEDELYEDYQDRLKGGVTAATRVTASSNYDTKLIAKWLKAKFDDEAFGTAYTLHHISDADAYMGRNKLTYNRKNNTIDLWKSSDAGEDVPVYKVIPQYSSTKKQGTYAPKLPKLVPIDEWNATHGVTASSKVLATEDNSYANHLIKISYKDAKYTLANLNKSHKTLGLYGEPGDAGYYVSEFEEATPGFMWASDTGLKILDDAGIPYTRIEKYKIESSKKIKASDNPFYDKLSESSKRFVRNTEKKMASTFSPYTFDVYNAILPYIGDYESNTGWTGSCELMKVPDKTAVDGYIYKVIWDGNESDVFSWMVNDNPRVDGEFTLMVMYAHGMPDFCDNEKDFYRAIRKVFGNGLRKV